MNCEICGKELKKTYYSIESWEKDVNDHNGTGADIEYEQLCAECFNVLKKLI